MLVLTHPIDFFLWIWFKADFCPEIRPVVVGPVFTRFQFQSGVEVLSEFDRPNILTAIIMLNGSQTDEFF